jgi:hypothetical protein
MPLSTLANRFRDSIRRPRNNGMVGARARPG